MFLGLLCLLLLAALIALVFLRKYFTQMLLKVSHRWWCLTMFLHLLFMCQIQPWSSSMTVEKRGTFTSNDRRHPWTAGVTFSHLYTNKYYYSILGSHDNNYLHDNWTTPTAEESNVMCLKASETISKLDHVLITKKIKTIRDLLYILLYIILHYITLFACDQMYTVYGKLSKS